MVAVLVCFCSAAANNALAGNDAAYCPENCCLGNLKGDINDNLGSANTDLKRFTYADNFGTSSQCRGSPFRPLGQRMQIERIGTDPFESYYKVTGELCWFWWAGECNHWGNTSDQSFGEKEVDCKQEKDLFAGMVKLCKVSPNNKLSNICLLYTSPSPRDRQKSRMPSSA